MSDILDDIIPMLKANGFTFKRSNGKHEQWADGTQNFTLPRGKCTSHRMFYFLRRELRKKCRIAGREYVDIETTKQKEKPVQNQFNKPTVIIRREGAAISQVSQPTPRPEWKPVETKPAQDKKRLDQEAFELCMKLKAQNFTQIRMAQMLAEMGYINKAGNPVNNSDISYMLIARGVRTNKGNPKIKQRRAQKLAVQNTIQAQPSPVKVDTQSGTLVHDITEILTAPFSDELKAKFIKQYFGVS